MKFFIEKPYQTIIFLLYIIISLIIVCNHEPWFDEAQAWLIARDCNFSQLMEQMKYEGTPALWHIILMPLAKFNIPYFSMQVLHWLLATGIIFLLLFYSPFSLLMKAGITFSYSMIYEYVAKARCYSLAVLLFLGIATIYPKRMQKPLLYAFLIALLCQTHLILIPASFGLALVFTWEVLFSAENLKRGKTSYFLSILVMALAGLLSFFQIYPPKSANPYMAALEFKIPVVRIWENYIASHSGLVSQYSAFQYTEQVKLAAEIGFNIFIVILFLVTIIALRRTNLFVVLFCSFLGIFAIQCVLAEFFPRHYGIYVASILAILWMGIQSGNFISKNIYKILIFSLHLLWISSLPFAIFYTIKDIKYPYSQSREAAIFLKENHLEQYPTVAYQGAIAAPILPYLTPEKKFWYPHNQDWGSFARWDTDIFLFKDTTYQEVLDLIDKVFFQKNPAALEKPVVVIFCGENNGKFLHPRLKLLFCNPRQLINSREQYCIYLLEQEK